MKKNQFYATVETRVFLREPSGNSLLSSPAAANIVWSSFKNLSNSLKRKFDRSRIPDDFGIKRADRLTIFNCQSHTLLAVCVKCVFVLPGSRISHIYQSGEWWGRGNSLNSCRQSAAVSDISPGLRLHSKGGGWCTNILILSSSPVIIWWNIT